MPASPGGFPWLATASAASEGTLENEAAASMEATETNGGEHDPSVKDFSAKDSIAASAVTESRAALDVSNPAVVANNETVEELNVPPTLFTAESATGDVLLVPTVKEPPFTATAAAAAPTNEMEIDEQGPDEQSTAILLVVAPPIPAALKSPLSPGASSAPLRSPGKRPSPWREPRLDHALPPPAKDIVVDHSKKAVAALDPERVARHRHRLYRKLFGDAIAVHIPLSLTVDLGAVVQRQRTKRVACLYREFPALTPTDTMPSKSTDPPSKALPKLKHVPQPHDYTNTIDYLEAKYVQGVVIYDDDDVAASSAPSDGKRDDEGDGSVYSDTSFLDDTGLQRTVAEQVLGFQTATKMELMGTNEDDGFFVNVGALEVEETELTQESYDPLDDTKRRGQGTSVKKSRKRKQPAAPSATSTAPASPSEKPKKKAKTDSGGTTAAKKEPKPSDKPTDQAQGATKDPAVLSSRTESENRKKEVDVCYVELVAFIKGFTDEELPRKPKPKRTRVTVTIPLDQKLKETVVFANPHVPGQRITAKIPPNLKPGDSFKVMVRKPMEKEEEEDEPGKDHNKLSREFYDKLEDYSRMYDEWCDAEGVYRKALGGDKSYQPHLAKRLKFDTLVTEFPKDMKTVADKDYLKKILRRARQNKHKREQTLARQMKLGGSIGGGSLRTGGDDDDSDTERGVRTNTTLDDDGSSAEDEKPKAPVVAKKAPVQRPKPAPRTVVLPERASTFPTKVPSLDDFKEKLLKPVSHPVASHS